MRLIQHILVPTDFDSPSLRALRYAVRLARAVGAELSILHIDPAGTGLGGILVPARNTRARRQREEARTRELHHKLERLARSVPRIDELRVRLVVRTGSPDTEIAECASEDGIDLLVLGTRHAMGSLAHRLAGGTAESTLRLAPCPVLVIREEESEAEQRAPTTAALTPLPV